MEPKKNFFNKSFSYLNKKENQFREYLRKRPILLTLIGGVAVVLFWRGVWHTADLIPFLSGPVSIILSTAVLLVTGLFAFSFFMGDVFMLPGIKKEEKLVQKTESEVKKEGEEIVEMKETLAEIRREIEHIHKDHEIILNHKKEEVIK
jgi:hypothetical protein